MAFGQSSGPPATGKQVRELLELLEAAGHSDFRDAHGPMGFTQRQAGGKFTRNEADKFIRPPRVGGARRRLVGRAGAAAGRHRSSTNRKRHAAAPAAPRAARGRTRRCAAEQLAAELQRRESFVVAP